MKVELVCAIDIDEEKAKAFAEKFNCHYCTDLETALQYDIDVIHLCLPHYLHPIMAVKAMEAGLHVLTEKPVAVSLQDDGGTAMHRQKAWRYIPDPVYKKCGKAERTHGRRIFRTHPLCPLLSHLEPPAHLL